MKNSWDTYWENESNQDYWLKPDKSVVNLMEQIDRSKITNVLDLGCGIGRHTLFLAKAGFNVTAVDSSIAALNILKRNLSENRVKVKVINANYLDDIFPEKSFDFILAYNVIYHGNKELFKKCIYLVHKWLKQDGLFYFTCPTRQDAKYGNGESVAPSTFRSLNSVHPGDIHYFASEDDITDFLVDFRNIDKSTDEHYWNNVGTKQLSSYWQILAKK